MEWEQLINYAIGAIAIIGVLNAYNDIRQTKITVNKILFKLENEQGREIDNIKESLKKLNFTLSPKYEHYIFIGQHLANLGFCSFYLFGGVTLPLTVFIRLGNASSFGCYRNRWSMSR